MIVRSTSSDRPIRAIIIDMPLRPLISILLWLGLAAACAQPAGAEVYKYQDEQGRTHYVTDAAKIPRKYQDQASAPHKLPKINKVKSISKALPMQHRSGASSSAAERDVEIFVTAWCPYCAKLEKFLKAEGIRYTRYDIEKSKVGARKYNKLGVRGVPIVRVGSTIIPGYNESAILSALK